MNNHEVGQDFDLPLEVGEFPVPTRQRHSLSFKPGILQEFAEDAEEDTFDAFKLSTPGNGSVTFSAISAASCE